MNSVLIIGISEDLSRSISLVEILTSSVCHVGRSASSKISSLAKDIFGIIVSTEVLVKSGALRDQDVFESVPDALKHIKIFVQLSFCKKP